MDDLTDRQYKNKIDRVRRQAGSDLLGYEESADTKAFI